MDMTYSKYLQLDKILEAQNPQTPEEQDEMLFIIIHQTYELWFKQMLHEVSYLQITLEKGNGQQALATLGRILTILKTAVSQVDILETMTPISFASFRSRLATSSGLQSWQFRKFESLLGAKQPHMIELHKHDPSIYQELLNDLKKPTIYDSLFKYLESKEQFSVPKEILNRDYSLNHEPSDAAEDLFYKIYQGNEVHRLILENFVDLDEGLQEWRYRHVKMVERTIGAKPGTGGSKGVEFLKNTLFKPLFPELWSVRSRF